MPEEKKSKKIGGIWNKVKDGKSYFSGQITIDNKIHNISIFENSFKEHEKQPDYIIYKWND